MPTPKRNIFIVDDDPFHLQLMKQILQSQNEENISLFSTGVDCLENIHLKPQIVFLDHNMDIYTGYEVLRKIKRYDPNIFVIMVSSQEEISTAVNSLKHGAFDYVQKNQELEKTITETLQKVDEISALLKQRKPTILKSILKYI